MFNILFVDDDSSLRFIISKMKVWKYSEFHIKKQAKNGEEALNFLESYDFDLVITDIRMPILDGLELLEIINKRNIDTLVVLASTYSEFEYAKKGLQLGAVDYIIKPLNEDNMRQMLDRVGKLLICKNEKSESIKGNILISQSKIDKWYEDIINDEMNEKELLKSFYKEIENLAIGNKKGYPIMLENILNRVWQKLCGIHLWLNNIEHKDFKVSADNTEYELLKYIKDIKELVKKYMLDKQDNLINKACNIIINNIGNGNILEIVSNELELSKDYISKLFKRKLGITMIEYCTIIKMEYAKNMIHSSNKKIYEISDFLGYSTVDYFTKLFKNYIGETPTKYRKKLNL